ncbi:MAG: type II secretion system protein GspD [Alphaproteobacteria bacterium]
MSPFKSLILCAFALIVFSGCELAENTMKADRAANLDVQDYRDAFAQRYPDVDDKRAESRASIPDFQPYVADVSETMKPMPLVSISVNQTVPIKDVLYELAQQADYDLELDPSIRGSIIFTARDRPFDQVIQRISEIAGLRYNFDDDVLRVEVDRPYNKTYKIEYLNYIRTNSGTIRNDIAVVSGDGADTGSTFEASITSEADFWGELEANIGQILGNAANRSLRTNTNPRITAVDQNPDIGVLAPQTDAEGNVSVSAPEAVLRVDSLPVDDAGAVEEEASVFSFAVNRQAGLVTVFASESAHKELQDYLTDLRRVVTAQVLIEAKILEVTLEDQFAAGIEWSNIDLLSGELGLSFSGNGVRPGIDITGRSGATNANFVTGYVGNDISAFVQAIQGFGTVRALASPRLTVLNNQSAIMNIATNQVFFEIDIDRTEGTDGQGDTVEIETEIRNVPEGVLVNVIPSIDLDSRTISLAVRPTITRIVNEVQDPGVAFVAGDSGIVSLVPELNVQEIDSVLRMNSGEAVVLGGLLQDRVQNTSENVPVVSEVPVFGSLFKRKGDSIEKTELVILLKATIVENGNTIHDTDRDLYRRFSQDRRPFSL